MAWLGAVQAQDFAMARWGLGLRGVGLTDAASGRAFDDGFILRTHVMRPMWHFVSPADIRWLQSLTAPRVHAFNAPYYRKHGLDAATFAKSRKGLERTLRDHRYQRRAELAVALDGAGLPATGERLALLVMHALHALMQALLEPATHLPPEAEAELKEIERQDWVRGVRAASFAYLRWIDARRIHDVDAGVLVGRAVETLKAAERIQFAQAWRLRQLLPEPSGRASASASLGPLSV